MWQNWPAEIQAVTSVLTMIGTFTYVYFTFRMMRASAMQWKMLQDDARRNEVAQRYAFQQNLEAISSILSALEQPATKMYFMTERLDERAVITQAVIDDLKAKLLPLKEAVRGLSGIVGPADYQAAVLRLRTALESLMWAEGTDLNVEYGQLRFVASGYHGGQEFLKAYERLRDIVMHYRFSTTHEV